MGNATLTKLWNVCPDNFEAASGKFQFWQLSNVKVNVAHIINLMNLLFVWTLAPERDFLPNMEDYFAEATEQLDPANEVEDQYK